MPHALWKDDENTVQENVNKLNVNIKKLSKVRSQNLSLGDVK